jgi:hypothetical protein
MFPSITKRLFIIKEIDTASECSNMAVLGNASATPVISIMSRLTLFYIKQIIRVVDALQLCCGKKLSNEKCLSFTNTVQVNGVGNRFGIFDTFDYFLCYTKT